MQTVVTFDGHLPEARREYVGSRIGDLSIHASGLKVLILDSTDRGCAEIAPIISGICPSFRLAELAIHLPVTPGLWDFVLSQPAIQRLIPNCWYMYRPCVHNPQTDIPSPIPANVLTTS